MNLRPRKPLREIPLPTTSYPSPISIPLKRNAPGSGGQCKMRKCSSTDRQTGCETVKKTRVATTRSLKTFYEKDDLGIGKSPSRRLFVDEDVGTRYGIVGAVSNPRSSPCLSSRSSPCPTTPITPIDDDGVGIPLPNLEGENGTNIHDPGFTIYNDTTKRYFPQSPISTRNNVPNYPLAIDAPSHIPSSPCSVPSYAEDEDQENIPPQPGSMVDLMVGLMDTPRKREWEKREKSKLGLEYWVDPPSEPSDPFDEGFELTPGKSTGRVDIRLARRALLREVDRL